MKFFMAEGTGEGNQTGGGTGAGDKPAWIAQLPADLKDNESFTQYKTIGDLAKAHLEISGKVKDLDGMKAQLANSIPKLKPDAKPEEREAYFKALGRPDKPDEYEFEGKVDDAMGKWFRDVAHKSGLNKDQAKSLQIAHNALMTQLEETRKAAAEADETAATEKLQKELGDKYPAVKTLAERMWKKHFGDNAEFKKFLTTPTREGMLLGNNPYLIRLIAKCGELTGEDLSSSGTPPQEKGKGDLQTFYDHSPGMFDANQR